MKIGPYEVLSQLGQGGMGTVYRVRCPDGREAALKLLAGRDAMSLARFDRERRLLASLGEEQGFVGLLDAGVSTGGAWLLMPFVPCGTLRGKLAAGPLGVAETVALGIELATALGRAHERGIVHRDMKPENVLFAASGRALVADMGLAKHFDPGAHGASQSVELTRNGAFLGTAGYMAPEQLVDATRVGPEADIFALGAVLHECLAGLPTFRGESVLEVLTRIGEGAVEPIARPAVPVWLVEVLARCLARDPRNRFPGGSQLARALERGAAARRPARRVGPLALGGVLGGLALVGVLPLLLSRPGHAPAPSSGPVVVATRPPSPAALTNARELGERAEKECDSGELDGAIADATRAIELDPGLAVAWRNRGIARGKKGDFDGEIADETSAIALDPTLPTAWCARGAGRGKKGDTAGMIEDQTRAIELSPGFAVAWANRGQARGSTGDLAGEIEDETRAIELAPRFAAAWSNRGIARGARGDLEGAIADTTRAIELEPGSAAAWCNRGSARQRKNDYEGAISDYERYLELAPDAPEAPSVREARDALKKLSTTNAR